jgi:arginine:ornithine antiporter / lysine permease
VQIFLLVTLFSKASYLALISLSTAMILVPYLFSALYGVKVAFNGEKPPNTARQSPNGGITFSRADVPIAALAAIYCAWLLYAAGLKYLLLAALLYAPGAILYIVAKRQRAQTAFTAREWVVLALLVGLAAVAAYLLSVGQLKL